MPQQQSLERRGSRRNRRVRGGNDAPRRSTTTIRAGRAATFEQAPRGSELGRGHGAGGAGHPPWRPPWRPQEQEAPRPRPVAMATAAPSATRRFMPCSCLPTRLQLGGATRRVMTTVTDSPESPAWLATDGTGAASCGARSAM